MIKTMEGTQTTKKMAGSRPRVPTHRQQQQQLPRQHMTSVLTSCLALLSVVVLLLSSRAGSGAHAERVTIIRKLGHGFAPDDSGRVVPTTFELFPLQVTMPRLAAFVSFNGSALFSPFDSLSDLEELGDSFAVRCRGKTIPVASVDTASNIAFVKPHGDHNTRGTTTAAAAAAAAASRLAVVFPTLAPHNRSGMARFLSGRTQGWRQSHGWPPMVLARQVEPDTELHEWNDIISQLQGPHANSNHDKHRQQEATCVLQLYHTAAQHSWPVVTVQTARGDSVVGRFTAFPVTPKTGEPGGTHTSVYFDMGDISKEQCQRAGRLEKFQKDKNARLTEHGTWHMGSTASLATGSSGGGGGDGNTLVTSFLQVQGFTRILGGAVDALMKPLLDGMMGEVTRGIEQTMNDNVGQAASAQVPPQVLELVTDPMKLNASNLIVDVASFQLVQKLSAAFTNEMGPTVVDQVAMFLIPELHKDLDPVVKNAVGDDLIKILPQLLKRSIGLVLTARVSRALTHALVPALTMSVAHATNPGDDPQCMTCMQTGHNCEKCHSSTSAVYYNSYYGAYYADYYAEYYQAYYVDALLQIDIFRNPEGPAKKERKQF